MSSDQIVRVRSRARPADRDPEPVEVRRGPLGGAAVPGPPEQFLRSGSLWVVRGAERVPAAEATLAAAVEQWWVSAGQGLTGSRGRFVLSRDEDDRWWLSEASR